jgi:hypothetical protein
MKLWILGAVLLMAQAAPSADNEAETLGRRLAEAGTLAALLPTLAAKDREELIAENPGLSDA